MPSLRRGNQGGPALTRHQRIPNRGGCNGKGFEWGSHVVAALGFTVEMQKQEGTGLWWLLSMAWRLLPPHELQQQPLQEGRRGQEWKGGSPAAFPLPGCGG